MSRTQTAAPARSRAGFTMIEMVMSIGLFLLVIASAIPFFRTQARAIDSQSGRMDAVQNTRYVNTVIDRQLRLAGGVTGQPIIVQATPFSVTFNVDLVTRLSGDPGAVYYNPDADSLSSEGWLAARAKTLPTSAKVYPTTSYVDAGGILSSAETISFFVRPDATTGRNDTYVLYRRVNDRDSTVIARNLIIPTDTAWFFKYWRTDSSGTLQAITAAQQPLYWDAANGWADSIRVVDMRVSALYRDARQRKDIVRTVYSSTKLLNAGLLRIQTCGASPLGPQAAQADTLLNAAGQVTAVRVTWTKSLEETAGEKDISRYVVGKRLQSNTIWTELAVVKANLSTTYTFDDTQLTSATWIYGDYSQDCTPQNSGWTQTSSVVIP
jgi:type II secretory pathway pseudopilin PulG